MMGLAISVTLNKILELRRVGTKGLSSSNGVLGGFTGLLGGSSNNYRSNLTLAPSSSQSIYQSAGALSFPTPQQAQISPSNYNTYAPIQVFHFVDFFIKDISLQLLIFPTPFCFFFWNFTYIASRHAKGVEPAALFINIGM